MMYSVLCNPELSKIVDFHFHIYTSYVFFQSYLITSLLLVVYSIVYYKTNFYKVELYSVKLRDRFGMGKEQVRDS